MAGKNWDNVITDILDSGVFIRDDFLNVPGLSFGARCLWYSFLLHGNKRAVPPQKQWAEEMGMSLSTLRRKMRELRGRGLVVYVRKKTAPGRNRTYRLLWPIQHRKNMSSSNGGHNEHRSCAEQPTNRDENFAAPYKSIKDISVPSSNATPKTIQETQPPQEKSGRGKQQMGLVRPLLIKCRDKREHPRWMRMAEALFAAISSRHKVNHSSRLRAWADQLYRLHKIDGAPTRKIRQVLLWYCQAYRDEMDYLPVAEGGRAFREKFFAIDNAMRRREGDIDLAVGRVRTERIDRDLTPEESDVLNDGANLPSGRRR